MASTLPIESSSSTQSLENLPKEFNDWFEAVKKIEGLAKSILRVIGQSGQEKPKVLLDDPFDLIQTAKDYKFSVSGRPFQEEDFMELIDDIKKFAQGSISTMIRVHATAYDKNGTLLNEKTWTYLL